MNGIINFTEAEAKKAEEILESVSDDEDELIGDAGEWAGINSVNEESGIVKTANMLQRISTVGRSHSRSEAGIRSREASFQSEVSEEHVNPDARETVIEVGKEVNAAQFKCLIDYL